MDIEETKMNPPREKLLRLWKSVQDIVTDPTAEDSKLSEDHENRIRRHYSQLLSNLNVPDVVTQMFQSGKLTAKDHEHIRQFYPTPIKASEELLNIIIINSRDVYDCFLESLKKTKQHHVYQMLTSDEERVCIDEQFVSEHSRLIRQNYDWLTESLDPDSGLLTSLISKEVLSQREYGQVVSEKDRFVKNEILLSIISRKSVEDFRKFIMALNDTSQGYITNRLTKTPVGDACQNVTTTVNKKFPTRYSGSLGKRIPPKTPPKPKKQPSKPPSKKPFAIMPRPLLEQRLQPSKLNQTEKRQNYTKHEIVTRQSVEYLEAKFRGLPNELQTEVSTKLVQLHQRKSTDSIWQISFTKLLQESRNMKNIIEKLEGQVKHSEMKLKERATELRDSKDKLNEKDTALKTIALELKETKARFEHTKTKLTEFEAKFIATKKGTDNFKSQDVEEKLLDLKCKLEEESKLWAEEKNQLMKQAEELQQKYSDAKSKLFDLKNNWQEERKVWTEERNRFMKQAQELKEESSDDLQDEYKSVPVLVHTMITKSSQAREAFFGFTILDKALFVVSNESSTVQVYDSIKFSFSRRWKLKELIDPTDIVSCNRNKCLYIFDYKGDDQSKEILRVDANGKLIKKWSTGDDYGCRLSVTDELSVVFAVENKNKLNVYSPDGQLIREMDLSLHAGINRPFHAIKLANGQYVVSQGHYGDNAHRVCVVSSDGKLKKSFDGEPGSSIGKMKHPIHLVVDGNGFVMVADHNNNRVLLLDSNLEFKREILSKEKHELRDPQKILLDESNGRLLVAHSESHNQRISIFVFK